VLPIERPVQRIVVDDLCHRLSDPRIAGHAEGDLESIRLGGARKLETDAAQG
jgi:hypothetical protein